MPLPFDLLAVMLFIGYFAETPAANPPSLPHSLGVVAAALLFVAAISAGLSYFARRALRRPRSAAARRVLAGHVETAVRLFLVGAFMETLALSGIPWSLAARFGFRVAPDSFPLQMSGLAPYILLFFAGWIPQYRLHRETVPGRWTLRSFLVHKARYNLYMLIAWIPFAFLADWLGEFLVVLPVLFLGAAWAFPFFLARAWGCERIREGDVANRVADLEKLAGVHFSRLYLWEPGGGNTQNAAAVGILPPFRYLFLTPAIIRGMKPDELEAVILHELGHIRNKHLLFYLFTSLAGINSAVLAGLFLPLGSAERFILTVCLVLGYFRFVFGWLSRNMERQADLFALEKTGTARELANALEKLGIAAGHIRRAASWHHLGIAERVDFLRRAERNPLLARAHNAGVRGLMLTGYLLSAALICAMSWLVYSEASMPPPILRMPGGAAAALEDRAHWRRVLGLMPESADATLELAHSLARTPGDRGEAARLADRAMRLASRPEARDAAARLLKDLDE